MKNIFFIFLLLLLGIGIGYLIFNPTPTPVRELNFAKPTPTPVVLNLTATPNDYYASFGIFTHNIPRFFSHSIYHNLSVNAFIEPQNPNVVRVKKSDMTWDGFFKTLPFFLDKNCLTLNTGQSYCNETDEKLLFFLNGINDPDALKKVIKHGDKLLIIYGAPPSETALQNFLQQIPTIQ